MPKRIHLDESYIKAIQNKQKPMQEAVANLEVKHIPCAYCNFRTIDKFSDLTGHFSAFCPRCGQVAVYNAADYRRYSYIKAGSKTA